MKIHEYQAREILKAAGVPIPPSSVIDTIEAAGPTYTRIAGESGQSLVVVKAQVHA
ncbi:MAG: succinate--CoA ligase subunit beta, partial [Phycisphaerales bacterium]|nr:succinate--CoA ligase subunit beta [Phycisphaerales bacterium]